MSTHTKTLPIEALQFLAPAELQPAIENSQRTLSGLAYAGGVITDHGYFDRVAFDLSTTRIDGNIPLLFGHDHSKTVGVVTSSQIQENIQIQAKLFTDFDTDSQSIAAKADAGLNWQMSVGIWPGEILDVKAGSQIELNQQTFEGPLTVFKNNRIREVSVVALGADHKTSAQVFNGGTQITLPYSEQENMMADQTPEIESGVNDAVIEENKTLKAKVAELENTIAEFKAEQRNNQVKALFAELGRDYCEKSASVYQNMDAETFAAVAEDMLNNKPKLPEKLFQEQATGETFTAFSNAGKKLLNQVAGVN